MRIIDGGDVAFDALAYGVDRPVNTMQYFQQEINNISQTLTDAGKGFFSNVRELYNDINNSETLRLARSAIQSAVTLFKPDTIMPLISIEQFQTASLQMQRWIMANPVVRERYHAQKIDGYSDSYVDMQPGLSGENQYDYRRVMDCVVQEDQDDSWFVKYYLDDLHEGDKELTPDEKSDILRTWDLAELFIRAGDRDPTSPYGSKM